MLLRRRQLRLYGAKPGIQLVRKVRHRRRLCPHRRQAIHDVAQEQCSASSSLCRRQRSFACGRVTAASRSASSNHRKKQRGCGGPAACGRSVHHDKVFVMRHQAALQRA
jgi:hypothetical protein